MNEEIIQFIKNQWNIHFKSELGTLPKGLSFVQLSQSHTKNYDMSRIILLIFGKEGEKPIMIAKFTKDRSYEDSLKKEHINAETLNKALKKKIFPHVYAEGYISGKLVIFEEYVDGKNVDAILRAKGVNVERIIESTEEIFGVVKSLLSSLNNSRESSRAGEVEEEINTLVEKLKKEGKIEEDVVERIASSAKLISKSINKNYKGIVNMDFVPSNIFKTNSGTRIIDFEFSDESALSFIEPARFLHYYIELLGSLGVLEVNDIAVNLGMISFDSKHWLHKLIKKYFGGIIDVHLLSEYFLVSMIHDFLLQLKVDYDSKNRKEFFMNIYYSLTNFVEYNYSELGRKRGLLQEAENKLHAQKQQQSIEKEELEDLRARMADINGSKLWRIFGELRKFKRKIFK